MLNRIKAKLRKRAGDEVVTVTNGYLVLQALCAYRDQILLADYRTPATQVRLERLKTEIDNVRSQLPVE